MLTMSLEFGSYNCWKGQEIGKGVFLEAAKGQGCAGQPGQGRWTGKQQVTRLESGTSKLEAKYAGFVATCLSRPVADT